MAASVALQPSAEGHPSSSPPSSAITYPSFQSKSFSSLFSSNKPAAIDVHVEKTTRHGEPAVVFSPQELSQIASPFQTALVGKFSKGRPSMVDIQKFFTTLNLKGSYSVGLLDHRHVLIRLENEHDFHRIWGRNIWYLYGYPMRVFKWSTSFHVDKEPSMVPVWFSLPKLPIHLFRKECLFHIVGCIGRPLFMDAATIALSRPSVARVCVEVDLLKPLPARVWIGTGIGDVEGFWQPLNPKNLPKYCAFCFRQGHAEEECRIKHPDLQSVRKQELGKDGRPVSREFRIKPTSGVAATAAPVMSLPLALSGPVVAPVESVVVHASLSKEGVGFKGKEAAGMVEPPGLDSRVALTDGEEVLAASAGVGSTEPPPLASVALPAALVVSDAGERVGMVELEAAAAANLLSAAAASTCEQGGTSWLPRLMKRCGCGIFWWDADWVILLHFRFSEFPVIR